MPTEHDYWSVKYQEACIDLQAAEVRFAMAFHPRIARDDVDLFDCTITEVIGESYDSRRLALYRVEGKGLFWLPRWAVTFKV